jgi:hypothetical protein
MNRPAFFDTNIFLCADDASAPAKQVREETPRREDGQDAPAVSCASGKSL